MRNRKGLFLLMIIILCLMVGLFFYINKQERIRYATLNEAITKGIKNDIQKTIHMEIVNNYVIYIYETTKDELGAAVFEESEEEGWRKDSHHWEYAHFGSFSVEHEFLYPFEHLVYGKINNQDITSIEISLKDGTKQATIIEKEGEKYYYSFLGEETLQEIKALTADGRVIIE